MNIPQLASAVFLGLSVLVTVNNATLDIDVQVLCGLNESVHVLLLDYIRLLTNMPLLQISILNPHLQCGSFLEEAL